MVPPEKPCLIHDAMDDTQVVTWGDFNRRTNNLARRFLNRGAQASDKVAFYLRNCPAYLEGARRVFQGAPDTRQRELSLRRRRALVHPRQLGQQDRHLRHRSSPSMFARCANGCRMSQCGLKCATDTPEVEFAVSFDELAEIGDGNAARHAALRRRHDLSLHRRNDRHAEGRDVGARGSLAGRYRGCDAGDEHDCAEERRRARSERQSCGRHRRTAAVLSVDARYRTVHRNRHARARRHGGHDGRQQLRCRRGVGNRRAPQGDGARDRWRCVR